MIAVRYEELKRQLPNPQFASDEEKAEFARTQQWEKRSAAAKRAVQTKRARYSRWPANYKDKRKHAQYIKALDDALAVIKAEYASAKPRSMFEQHQVVIGLIESLKG